MRTKNHLRTKGQIIVIFALGLVVLVAMAALVLDGGMLYLNRRTAQAAADAGALAGARVMCYGATYDEVVDTAEQYAMDQNSASEATAYVDDFPNGDVTVDVNMHQDSFFAQVFGINYLEVPATASANCYPPEAAKHVLPVAWACRAPVAGSDSDDCTILTLDWETEMKPLIRSNFFGETGDVIIHGETVARPPFIFTGKDGIFFIFVENQSKRCVREIL